MERYKLGLQVQLEMNIKRIKNKRIIKSFMIVFPVLLS